MAWEADFTDEGIRHKQPRPATQLESLSKIRFVGYALTKCAEILATTEIVGRFECVAHNMAFVIS